MRKLLLASAAALLFSVPAMAQQYYTAYPLGSTPTGSEILGPVSQGGVSKTFSFSSIVGQTPVIPKGATNSFGLPALLSQVYVAPDWFKATTDGTDDTPSINRAITSACASGAKVQFFGRTYNITAPISVSCHVNMAGVGFAEPAGSAIAYGTVLHLVYSAAFNMTDAIVFNGNPTAGSIVSDLAITEDQPAIATGWAPNPYGYVLSAQSIGGGMTFQNILCMNCSYGIKAHISGRTVIRDFRGQFFNNEIYGDKNYDSSTIDNARNWPFWSQSVPVLTYQLANLDTFILGREDDLQSSNLFTYGARSGLRLITTAAEGTHLGGSATMIHIGFAKFESCQWGLWPALVPTYFDEGSMRIDFYSFQGQSPIASGVAQIAGAAAIRQDGWQTQISIGLLKADFIDANLIDNPSTTGATNFVVDQAFLNLSHGSNTIALLNAPTEPSALQIGTNPQIYSPSSVTLRSRTVGSVSTSVVSYPDLNPR